MKNQIIGAVIVTVIVVGGGAFYGAMQYGKGQNSSALRAGASVSPSGQLRQGGGRRGMPAGEDFILGEILSRDAQSVTIKLRDGGSKIAFFSQGTSVMKSASGTPEDLLVGEQVVITGSANQDGSMNAANIQIRARAALGR